MKETAADFYSRLSSLPIENQVEELASLFFSISDIASFIGMDPDNLKSVINFNNQSSLSKAYFRGKLKTKILLRFDTRNFAICGSPAAAADMNNFLINQDIQENA